VLEAYSLAAGGSSIRAKTAKVIRVRVPLDLHAVAATGCGAFSLVTPLRVDSVIKLAVRQVLGARAPADKITRSINATLSAFRAGEFTVDLNGRIFADPAQTIACAGEMDVRFFLRVPTRGVSSEILRTRH